MIRSREALYCNLKLFLIFLVVYGHLIEGAIGQSERFALQYRIIYLFHMPLFVFLTGLFLKSKEQCASQGRRMLLWYLILQCPLAILYPNKYPLSLPYWHLWYLLSLICWCGVGWLWHRFGRGRIGWKVLALALSVLLACLAGLNPKIGRGNSLSRTLVFLPFFLAGVFCPRDIPWKKLRPLGLLGLGLGYWAFRALDGTSVYFLYHAASYGKLGAEGILLRLWAMGAGLGIGLFLLTFTPGRRFPWTKMGNDTFPIFILHAPVVKYNLRQLPLTMWNAPVIAAVFLLFLFTLFRWRGPMCAIHQRKEVPKCPRSRKYMKHTASRSIGSSWP